jgi:FkbM family methyltransferase
MKRKDSTLDLLKQLASRLKPFWQNELKRVYFRWQIRRGEFLSTEPEYAMLPNLISPGDWVIDIGANVGHYTKRFSELVKEEGRVIAFEPVPETFSLLASNLQNLSFFNITLINAAVSDRTDLVGISIPYFETGLINYYQAYISGSKDSKLRVLTFNLDSMNITAKIKLVKIDAEGHESHVLKGMNGILIRDHPLLIVETNSMKVIADLKKMGYLPKKLNNSPNTLFY